MGQSGGKQRPQPRATAAPAAPPSATGGDALVERLTEALTQAHPESEAAVRAVVRSVLQPAAPGAAPPQQAEHADPQPQQHQQQRDAPAHPLEPDAAGMRELLEGAGERVVDYLGRLPELPTLKGVGYPDADLAAAMQSIQDLIEPELPERPTPYADLLSVIFDRCLDQGINTAHPGYMGHVGGGGILHAGIADLIADVANRQMAVWICCPGFVRIEMNVIRWFCNLAGLPAVTSLGVLTTGGSLAMLSGVVAARAAKLPDDALAQGRIYLSQHAHHCVAKAAGVAGFPARCVRKVPCDEQCRMRTDALRELIAEDREAGLLPFLVVATAGTTDTGAVDDLGECADICAAEGLWYHVDAAYGFFYLLTEEGRKVMRGIERADSIVLDPHKGLGLPYGTGCLLSRDHALLEHAHNAERGAYMPPAAGSSAGAVPDLVDFTACSPELSREFRGLRIWLPLRLYGAGPFRDKLEANVADARWAAEQLQSIEGVEVPTPPQLSILTFRLLPRPSADADQADSGAALERVNALNRELLKRVNSGGRVFVTPTTLPDGRFVVRLCVNAVRTHREQVSELVSLVAEGAKALRP
eukprot:TRINITY_DN11605_c0_g1_i1.p1 TRINITY_DN11605_c0_g1~~TRINITY_DN11605_c0_g1_i1.p1  ORF type:complete len:616 (+),score=202.62 TRINITY_DN11605_c0_g1_i1:91-1848(+)